MATSLDTLHFPASTSKKEVLDGVKKYLRSQDFSIPIQDEERPWGAYYYIDEIYKKRFAKQYFPDKDLTAIMDSGLKLTPKFLIVAPNEILSWQWHERRGELWNLVAGQAGYKASPSDVEPETVISLEQGVTIILPPETRHRLIGTTEETGEWGIVAEIWSHTDPKNPSNEEDNHRVKDKYART
ncbi:MAG: phosphoheptose isomerase [Patescibacteria group bacterium]